MTSPLSISRYDITKFYETSGVKPGRAIPEWFSTRGPTTIGRIRWEASRLVENATTIPILSGEDGFLCLAIDGFLAELYDSTSYIWHSFGYTNLILVRNEQVHATPRAPPMTAHYYRMMFV